jgi:lysophospholipase L1-like esterase
MLIFCLGALELALRVVGYFYASAIENSNRESLSNEQAIRILCIGDSITAMGGNHAWPRLLQPMLEENFHKPFAVINRAGINSNSNDLVRELDRNMTEIKPQLLCVMMGVNDRGLPVYEHNVTPPGRALWRSLRILEFVRLLFRNVFATKVPENETPAERSLLYEATKANYLRIAKITEKTGIPLLVAGYPNRPLLPLKEHLADFSHIDFIDNETSIRELLTKHSYDKIFIDNYREDFGHGTELGNREKAVNFIHAVKNSEIIAIKELFY